MKHPNTPTPRILTFHTSNEGKVREIRALLECTGIRVDQGSIHLPEIQADTLQDVAKAKLDAVPALDPLAMVEDSGLFVDSLRGFPGVYSAYALKTIGCSGLLHLMRESGRRAHFEAVIGLRDGPAIMFFKGTIEGQIAPSPRGVGGFGYDPIFIPDGSNLTFGEMSQSDKNSMSHRGRALRELSAYLLRKPSGPPF
ncbi:MAG TPA: RdgB/HAM1 family non-canonical purine NTP pyrophosphatase [Nitrososphaerales archaeon]|nr:RdgB/HAM1 family non-canonical purine NTP pyrophosphatase [Nitrososphaerales archaeon]